MVPVSVQLYTLRAQAKEDFFNVLRIVSEAGYTGVEFAGLHGKSPDEVAQELANLGLVASSSHVALPTRENINQLVDTENTLGSKYLISGFGPDSFATLDETKRSIAKFEEAAELVKQHGLSFGMHNHWWEFENKFEGRSVYDIVLKEVPDMFSELDVYWAAITEDPAEIVAAHKDRLPLLHIKDGPAIKGEPHVAVGSGTLNIPGIIQAADPGVLKWLVVELDECATDMADAVRESYRYLKAEGLGE